VKINPQSLGIGQYQHSVEQRQLEDALEYIVDKAVNTYGVNLQTASKTLLEHVSGLTASTAEAIIEARNSGLIHEREDLLKVQGIGIVTYEQAVGFLRSYISDNPLDQTLIHPDHYLIARSIIETTRKNIYNWKRLSESQRNKLLRDIDLTDFVNEHTGILIIEDIVQELIKYGSDPRGRKEFIDRSTGPTDIEALKEGMILDGECSNVLDFGAFIDIGIKENGLIHISNLADRYISNVRSIIKVGDQVKVEVIEIDLDRKRIGLRLIEVNGRIPSSSLRDMISSPVTVKRAFKVMFCDLDHFGAFPSERSTNTTRSLTEPPSWRMISIANSLEWPEVIKSSIKRTFLPLSEGPSICLPLPCFLGFFLRI